MSSQAPQNVPDLQSGLALLLTVANVFLLIANLAFEALRFVATLQLGDSARAIGEALGDVLFLLVAPVLIALAIANKFFKESPERTSMAIFVALLTTLSCCNLPAFLRVPPKPSTQGTTAVP